MADPTPQSFRLAVGQARRLVIGMSPAESIAGRSGRFRMRVPAALIVSGLIEKAMGQGVSRGDADAGVWWVDLDAADTAPLVEGLYRWSFWDVDSGEESPIAYGTCYVYRTAETG